MNWYDREARSTPIGLPGGPCHVIRNIEEADVPESVKDDLIQDVERGRDLSNQDASKVYDICSRLNVVSNFFI